VKPVPQGLFCLAQLMASCLTVVRLCRWRSNAIGLFQPFLEDASVAMSV